MISKKASRYLLIFLLCMAFHGCAAMNGAKSVTSTDTGADEANTIDLAESESNTLMEAKSDEDAADLDESKPSPDTCDLFPASDSPMTEGDVEPSLAVDNAAIQQSLIDQALSLCQKAQTHWQQAEQEEALDALDQAYAIILDLPTEADADGGASPKINRQKEDLRYMISKRILEIYASRKTTVKGNHNAIPIDINRHVQKEIDYLTKGSFFKDALQRSGKYRPYIVEEFKKAGLPVELSWLPLIESGFRVNALSPARALGLWQFIPSTGYKFGLKRDRFIDERLDPQKSTHAAIAYLKELHEIFGDWSTVLAAYNCGEGRVLKVIRSQNINYLDNFWDLFERLPYETARYVPRFLATIHIIKNSDKYDIGNIVPDPPPDYETISVSKQVCLSDVASAIGTRTSILKELNPELRQGVLPETTYELKIPPDKKQILSAKLDQIPDFKLPPPPPKITFAYHRVKRGESLSQVASRYGVGMKDIMRVNRLNRKNFIVAGKILKIPTSGTVKRTASKSTEQPPARTKYVRTKTYVVRSGDSLWNIARKFGTSTKKLRRMNHLRSSKLDIGQVLKVPGDDALPTLTAKSTKSALKIYQVKNGDFPGIIAQRHNMSLDRLLQVNNLSRGSKIYPGQSLYVE